MQYTTKQKIQVLRETSLPLSYVNLSVRLNQLRTGNMRVTCSNGTVSAVFFLSSGWLNSLRGRTITWDCPPFSITQPEFAAWYSRNLSNARPSMLIACKKSGTLISRRNHPIPCVNKAQPGWPQIHEYATIDIKHIPTYCLRTLRHYRCQKNIAALTEELEAFTKQSKCFTSARTGLGTFWYVKESRWIA